MSPERLTPPEHPQIAGRTPDEWHKWLTTHNGEPAGHLEAPGSRYGRDADSCAWYAIAALAIYAEQSDIADEPEGTADWLMGLCVNDDDTIQALVQDWWSSVPKEVQEQLGGKEAVEELRDDHRKV